MTTRADRFDKMLGVGTLVALAVGCLVILTPFMTALMMAVILTYSTWPLYARLRRSVGGRRNLAAGLMMLAACLILIAPFVFVAFSLADSASELIDAVRKTGPGEFLKNIQFNLYNPLRHQQRFDEVSHITPLHVW